MDQQPFLIKYPKELGRLFATGYIITPSEKKWNISFCPGLTGSWKGFKECWIFAWKSFKWGWSPSEHGDILKTAWDWAGDFGNTCLNLIKGIPEGISKVSNNISKLYKDAPFGWIPRIFKNIAWNCVISPILKFIFGFVGMLIGTPLIFTGISLIGCISKFVIGNVGTAVSGTTSLVPLVGGTLSSALITLGAIFNRFPKESDHGTYGLYLVENYKLNTNFSTNVYNNI
jgi:hypothetical protein